MLDEVRSEDRSETDIGSCAPEEKRISHFRQFCCGRSSWRRQIRMAGARTALPYFPDSARTIRGAKSRMNSPAIR